MAAIAMRVRWWGALAAALAMGVSSCGDDEASGEREESSAETTPERTDEPPAASGPLLERSGELADADPTDARGRYDRYFVEVHENDRILVTLTSSAFDPILEATPPGSGMLVNDDYQGDRTRSQLELIARTAGQMKIEVRAYGNQGGGAYRVEVHRLGADNAGDRPAGAADVPVLTAGQSHDGTLDASDHSLSDGQRFESLVIHAESPVQITVSARGGAAPATSLVGPDGLALSPSGGRFVGTDPGNYRLQVMGAEGLGFRVEVSRAEVGAGALLARAHHQFSELLSQLGGTPRQRNGSEPSPGANPNDLRSSRPRALPVRVGDRLNGNLAENDSRLPSGELFDVYELTVTEPRGIVAIEMESERFDCFLRVEGPSSQHWENDDFGGTLNSRVELPLSEAGTYRIVTTSYRAGETGPYELKVLTQRDAPSPGGGGPSATPTSGPEQRIAGELAQGDPQLQSGEFMDEHTFSWPAGARIHLEAQSTEFDTYLIVHPPSGPQQDNDDMVPGQSLNAGLDLQTSGAGEWRVVVTSYQPGETGHYDLVVRGASAGSTPSTPPPSTPANTPPSNPPPAPSAGANVQRGELAQGDAQLNSGEFQDTYPMTFTPRSRVSIRLDSTDFDTYLIVRSPSGHQDDNDDIASGNFNSGVDIEVAEPGNYEVVVTSYRPGETGDYTLTVSEGESVVGPAPTNPSNGGGSSGTPAAAGSGGRVWGLFAGITDYPGSTNDLPECANDARKLAEAVRNQGNMPPEQEFLLTDSQATVAGIRNAMETIAGRIGPQDVFVFFYSGHGGQTDSSTDPREIDQRDEYMFVYDGQLMDDEMGQLFDRFQNRVSLVAIDACFAGGFAKDIITRPGRVGMFSSEEDVTSAVAGRFQAGGYLSHFLRLGIDGAADNDPHNNVLTVGELTHYTWAQFGQHASDVRMSMGYQHLVVDRGAVPTSDVLWAVQR